jgi:hypothetical protein
MRYIVLICSSDTRIVVVFYYCFLNMPKTKPTISTVVKNYVLEFGENDVFM